MRIYFFAREIFAIQHEILRFFFFFFAIAADSKLTPFLHTRTTTMSTMTVKYFSYRPRGIFDEGRENEWASEKKERKGRKFLFFCKAKNGHFEIYAEHVSVCGLQATKNLSRRSIFNDFFFEIFCCHLQSPDVIFSWIINEFESRCVVKLCVRWILKFNSEMCRAKRGNKLQGIYICTPHCVSNSWKSWKIFEFFMCMSDVPHIYFCPPHVLSFGHSNTRFSPYLPSSSIQRHYPFHSAVFFPLGDDHKYLWLSSSNVFPLFNLFLKLLFIHPLSLSLARLRWREIKHSQLLSIIIWAFYLPLMMRHVFELWRENSFQRTLF